MAIFYLYTYIYVLRNDISQTVSNTATVTINPSTGNRIIFYRWFAVDCMTLES